MHGLACCFPIDAGEEQRRLLGSNAERMRQRRERNWRQRLEMSRRLTESSSSSSKSNLDLVDTLRQLHQQNLQAFEHARQEERAEDKQERQQEKQERQQDRATTHRMIAAIERSHQTLADLMGRQTSAMEAIATAFSAPRYPSPGTFPSYNMYPGFSPPWSAPNSQERQVEPSGSNTTPLHSPSQDEPGTCIPDTAQNDAPPLLDPSGPTSVSLLLSPSPEAVPASSPPALSATPKRASKRSHWD